MQRCFEEDVQQCLDACPRSLRVRSRGRHVSQVNAVRQTDDPRRVPQRSKGLDPKWLQTMMMILIMMMLMMVIIISGEDHGEDDADDAADDGDHYEDDDDGDHYDDEEEEDDDDDDDDDDERMLPGQPSQVILV